MSSSRRRHQLGRLTRLGAWFSVLLFAQAELLAAQSPDSVVTTLQLGLARVEPQFALPATSSAGTLVLQPTPRQAPLSKAFLIGAGTGAVDRWLNGPIADTVEFNRRRFAPGPIAGPLAPLILDLGLDFGRHVFESHFARPEPRQELRR